VGQAHRQRSKRQESGQQLFHSAAYRHTGLSRKALHPAIRCPCQISTRQTCK
jgi:hypothetical protein